MGKAFWAAGVCIILMIVGILLMANSESAQGHKGCELESQKYGKKTVKVWDCD